MPSGGEWVLDPKRRNEAGVRRGPFGDPRERKGKASSSIGQRALADPGGKKKKTSLNHQKETGLGGATLGVHGQAFSTYSLKRIQRKKSVRDRMLLAEQESGKFQVGLKGIHGAGGGSMGLPRKKKKKLTQPY